jgi:conjugative transfer signal peptidase TraF
MRVSEGWRSPVFWARWGQRTAKGVLGVGLGLALGVGVAAALGLRINDSGSLPRGIYRVSSGRLTRGSCILVCSPATAGRLALSRGYLHPGNCPGGVMPLGKMVLGVGGDLVAVGRDAITVNGVPVPRSASRDRDEQGRALPTMVGRVFRLAPDQVWLYAPHPRSFDSRVFGPVSVSAIRGVLVPVWTEGEEGRLGRGEAKAAKEAKSSGWGER